MSKMRFANQVVAITGASGGLGLALAKGFMQQGASVYSLSRHCPQAAGIKHLYADVTKTETLQKAFEALLAAEGKLDILVNNAGMGISGSIENTDFAAARYIYDVNVLGVFQTTKLALPYLRANKQAKIINISSVAAEIAIPFQAFYSATKASINLFSEALATEVEPYGVQVMTVMPGDFQTNFTKNRQKNRMEPAPYKKRVERSLAVMEADEAGGITASAAAQKIMRKIKRRKLPLFYVMGLKYRLIVFLRRLLPRRMVKRIVGGIYGFKKE